MSLITSLRFETAKLKRTLSIYICLLGAFFGPFMSFLETLHPSPIPPKNQPWTQHFLEGREPISIALLPWYTILVCTLLMQIEYRDKTWKQVLTSPQRLFDVFMAKFLSLQSMIVLFLLSLNIFQALFAFATELVDPELYNGRFDLLRILSINTEIWILVLGMSAIQFWLVLRFKNFMVSLGIGLVGWFLSPMLIFEFKSDIVNYYPYAFTILPELPAFKGKSVSYQWYSLLTMVVFLTIAFVEFRIRKVRT